MLSSLSEAHNVIKSIACVKLGYFYKTALSRLYLRMTSNFWSSFLHLQYSGITDMPHHHTQFITHWESNTVPLHVKQTLYQLRQTCIPVLWKYKFQHAFYSSKCIERSVPVSRAIDCVARIRLFEDVMVNIDCWLDKFRITQETSLYGD